MNRRLYPVLFLLTFCILMKAEGQYPPAGNLIVNGDFHNGFAGWTGEFGPGTFGLYSGGMNPTAVQLREEK